MNKKMKFLNLLLIGKYKNICWQDLLHHLCIELINVKNI